VGQTTAIDVWGWVGGKRLGPTNITSGRVQFKSMRGVGPGGGGAGVLLVRAPRPLPVTGGPVFL